MRSLIERLELSEVQSGNPIGSSNDMKIWAEVWGMDEWVNLTIHVTGQWPKPENDKAVDEMAKKIFDVVLDTPKWREIAAKLKQHKGVKVDYDEVKYPPIPRSFKDIDDWQVFEREAEFIASDR